MNPTVAPTNFVKSGVLNILNGAFSGTIHFAPGLNILSGENGTLKTKILQSIKQGGQNILFSIPGQPPRISAISPKRNSERRAFDNIISTFRQQNRTLETLLNERANAQINDATFDNYPTVGELFYLVFEDRCKDGGDRRERMNLVAEEFNGVIQRVFDQNKLVATWNDQTGAPTVKISRGAAVSFPIEGLSLGQLEILSLVTSLHASRSRYDCFLIDEPEVHLNWHLEEKLFSYLADFCAEHQKQIIVATHSRTVFKSRFLPLTQFLTWNENGTVSCVRELSDDQRRRIAGEAIEIVKLGQGAKFTFFVEDDSHREILEELSSAFGKQISISTCGSSSNVRSLFRLSKSEGDWKNTYFLIDGDNEGNPFPNEANFIHLDLYCLDNYLLNMELAAETLGKSVKDIQEVIFNSISERREQIFRRNQFFQFLADLLESKHITQERLSQLDASEIIETYLTKLAVSRKQYLRAYIQKGRDTGRISTVFPSKLLALFDITLVSKK